MGGEPVGEEDDDGEKMGVVMVMASDETSEGEGLGEPTTKLERVNKTNTNYTTHTMYLLKLW